MIPHHLQVMRMKYRYKLKTDNTMETVYTDLHAVAIQISQIEKALPYAVRFVEALQGLGWNVHLSGLKQDCNDPDRILLKTAMKRAGENSNVPAENLVSVFCTPNEINNLRMTATEFRPYVRFLDWMTYRDGKIFLSKQTIEKIQDAHTVHADTPIRSEILSRYKAFLWALNDFNELTKESLSIQVYDLQDALKRIVQDGSISPALFNQMEAGLSRARNR